MNDQNQLSNKINHASKWSLASVVCTKLITPLTTMILARILTPDDFGVVAIATIIISFAEMFSEAGIGKYLIQKDFDNEDRAHQYRTVGLWANIILGLIVWIVIALLSNPLAVLFKEPSAASLILVASFQIVLRSFVAVQIAIMQRNFQFKKLFVIQILTVVVPTLLSIPLAQRGYGAWAIVIGNLSGLFVNGIVVWISSEWRPSLFFSFQILKDMLSFTIWSITESLTIWLTVWIDSIIVGIFVDTYTLGLYRNSTTIVGGIISILTAAFTPVIFSALSRLKNSKEEFTDVFLAFQRKLGLLLIPASVGFVLFGDTIAIIILGEKWQGAGEIVALWGSVSCLMALFTISGDAFRAFGLPKLSARAQLIHLIYLVPVCVIGGGMGFEYLLYARTLIRFQLAFVMVLYLKRLIPISFVQMMKNLIWYILFAGIMGIISLLLKFLLPQTFYYNMLNIGICVVVYFTLILLNKSTSQEVCKFIRNTIHK